MDDQLAARFFLLTHDEFTGRPRINRSLHGCGLVASQLAELVVADRVAIVDGKVVVVDVGPAARTTAFVLDHIARRTEHHTVETWTTTLAEMLHELLARELVAEGVLRREHSVVRRSERYPAADLLRAARSRLAVERMIMRPDEMDLPGAWLIALIWTLGIDRVLDPSLDRDTWHEVAAEVTRRMPTDLRALLDGVGSAAGTAPVAVRR